MCLSHLYNIREVVSAVIIAITNDTYFDSDLQLPGNTVISSLATTQSFNSVSYAVIIYGS